MEFIDNNRVKVDPPKKPKKCTATRFATIMGLNAWSTPFAAWCEITRTYEAPFEDTIYTVAGKIIEPKIADYLKARYFMDIKSPTDVYGADYFKVTWGDFFPDQKELGGMWDFLGDDFVVEVKTTKRAEDWRGADGKVEPPIYYKLQACLYAYLLGFDNVVMTCSFLEDKDYPIDNGDGTFDTTPTEQFKPDVKNTIVHEFKLSEEFPNFKQQYIDPALKFWNDHVLTGISPEFDEKKDAEILKALRKNVTEASDEDIVKLMKEGDRLKTQIDNAKAKIKEKEDRLKQIDDQVKKSMIKQFRDGDKNVEVKGSAYTWNVRKDVSKSFDQKRFEDDNPGVYEKYKTKETVKYVLTKKLIEEV